MQGRAGEQDGVRILGQHHPGVTVRRWVAQGGFAGDNIVPAGDLLEKFAGSVTRESFNFGHDAKGALLTLASERIGERRLVSKNVTHGVAWDRPLHSRIAAHPDLTVGARLAAEAMAVYLEERPEGKLLHDPLAAAAVLDPAAFRWVEVEVFRERGLWGARPQADTRTFITVGIDVERALAALLGGPIAGRFGSGSANIGHLGRDDGLTAVHNAGKPETPTAGHPDLPGVGHLAHPPFCPVSP